MVAWEEYDRVSQNYIFLLEGLRTIHEYGFIKQAEELMQLVMAVFGKLLHEPGEENEGNKS